MAFFPFVNHYNGILVKEDITLSCTSLDKLSQEKLRKIIEFSNIIAPN